MGSRLEQGGGRVGARPKQGGTKAGALVWSSPTMKRSITRRRAQRGTKLSFLLFSRFFSERFLRFHEHL